MWMSLPINIQSGTQKIRKKLQILDKMALNGIRKISENKLKMSCIHSFNL